MATNIFNPVQPDLVIANYFNLVQAIARKIKRRLPAHVEVEDLVQTGVIGLLEASSRYNGSVEFAAYANSRITGAILDELRKSDRCSRNDRRKAREAENAKGHLRAVGGTEPSREEIAKAVGIGLQEYESLLGRLESNRLAPSFLPEDSETAEDEISQLPAKDESPLDTYTKKQELQQLRTYIAQLKPRYQQVLRLYYFKEMGLRQIGEQMGVGEARICQIHKQALLELRRLIDARHAPAAAFSDRIQ